MSQYKQISATAQVKAASGRLTSLTVSSTSSGTIALYDSAAASTADPVIVNTVTPAAGTHIFFGEDGLVFSKGLYAVIANTLQVTLGYK